MNDLSVLDQMIFTAPQSNSQKGDDRWSIGMFCSQKLACVSEDRERVPGPTITTPVSHDGLIEVRGADNTRLVMVIANRLIINFDGKR